MCVLSNFTQWLASKAVMLPVMLLLALILVTNTDRKGVGSFHEKAVGDLMMT